MMRLFDRRDIEFLRAAQGFTPPVEAGFRRRRSRIFRAYLRSLRAELLAQDRRLPPLIVFRCNLRLAGAMIPAFLCLFRYRWNLGNVDLASVVRRLENILGEVRR